MYKFAPACDDEAIVFGAARPGYRDEEVQGWIEFMQNQGIKRVCCLLSENQLKPYPNLLETYQHIFGINQVLWTPIEDFYIVNPDVFINQIFPFLNLANCNQQRVVVHCAGGIGRTGHILTAWLIAGRGMSKNAAINAVKKTGRNPHEAVIAAPFKGRNPWQVAAELNNLLDECSLLKDN